MPTYDYQCRSCGQITEVVHSMTEEGPASCERCGGSLRRVLYPAGIIFKGSGFYSTDSRSSGNGSRRSPAPSGGAGTDAPKSGTSSTEGDGSKAAPAKKDAAGGEAKG